MPTSLTNKTKKFFLKRYNFILKLVINIILFESCLFLNVDLKKVVIRLLNYISLNLEKEF